MARKYLENLVKERNVYTSVLCIGCTAIEGKSCIAYFSFRYFFQFSNGYVHVQMILATEYIGNKVSIRRQEKEENVEHQCYETKMPAPSAVLILIQPVWYQSLVDIPLALLFFERIFS